MSALPSIHELLSLPARSWQRLGAFRYSSIAPSRGAPGPPEERLWTAGAAAHRSRVLEPVAESSLETQLTAIGAAPANHGDRLELLCSPKSPPGAVFKFEVSLWEAEDREVGQETGPWGAELISEAEHTRRNASSRNLDIVVGRSKTGPFTL